MPRYARTPAGVLVTDDPWSFDDTLGARGAEAKYKTVMTLEQIAAFPMPPLLPDCAMFMWRVAAGNETVSLGEIAYRIMRMRGFVPRSELVWRKLSRNGLPVDEDPETGATTEAFGLGYYGRGSHEVCYIGTRGTPVVRDHSIRTCFSAPVGEHSEKPDEFYNIVERMFHGPYVELFARKRRRGWIQYGDELR